MERDDALTELEIMKEKLDKALYSTQKTNEEKENAHKEYEKMLEKYDRYTLFYMSSCVGGDVMCVAAKELLFC
jgi:membrane protein YqaA with SNARE-associated domain